MMHNGRTARPPPMAGTRRAPIPRPWLTEHHYMHHAPGSHPLHHDYRYVPPLGAPYTYPKPNGSLDLLQRPDWKVSWSKLSCCFCTRSQKEAGGTKNVQDIHRRRGHNDNVPFPAFPILRRNSSSSLMLNENDIYPSGGSVSSFTDSDTSHSDSQGEKIQVRTDTFDSEELRRPESPSRPMTPTPEPVNPKPSAVKNRSQSAGLPTMKNPSINGNSSWGTPERQRIDTDYTRHSGTSNTSRHRRRVQYDFSAMSMDQIWQGKPVDDKLVLPSYVVCQNNSSNSVGEGSGYVSALDDSETDWGITSDNYDGDNDEDIFGANIAQSQQNRKHGSDMKRRDADRPPKASSARRRDQTGNLPPKRPAKRSAAVMTPTYLRKSAVLNKEARGNVVVSGWLAASIDNSSLEERFRSESTKGNLGLRDIWYLQIIELGGRARLDLRSSCGKVEHEIMLQQDWVCESREISSRVGRYVNIRSRNSLKTIISLLPVSLEDAFFSGEKLVPAQQFGKLYDRMFVSGKGRVYAPDEQHDAAMYIMFSLDTLIKNYLS